MLTTIAAFAAEAPRAVAISPSGWKRFWSAIGPTMIGVKCWSPNRLVVRSSSRVGIFIRGRRVMRSVTVRSLPAAGAIFAAPTAKRAWPSYSNTFTRSSRGAGGGGGIGTRSGTPARACAGGSRSAPTIPAARVVPVMMARREVAVAVAFSAAAGLSSGSVIEDLVSRSFGSFYTGQNRDLSNPQILFHAPPNKIMVGDPNAQIHNHRPFGRGRCHVRTGAIDAYAADGPQGGAGDQGAVSAPGHPVRWHRDAALSGGLTVPECQARGGSGEVHYGPGRAGAGVAHRQHP